MSYYRRPKTSNEKRQFYDCEISNIIRGRRRPRLLPNSWDDISIIRQRCWKVQSKKHRQHGFNQHLIRSFKRYQIFEEELY